LFFARHVLKHDLQVLVDKFRVNNYFTTARHTSTFTKNERWLPVEREALDR
jgi:hypothetical protein